MTVGRYSCFASFMAFAAALGAQPVNYAFQDAQAFLKDHCQVCHQGASPAGGFDLRQTSTAGSIRSEAARWSSVALRVRNGEMPPAGAPAPTAAQREQFTNWVSAAVRAGACGAGAMPSTPGIRRLNREEYAATVRDLLDDPDTWADVAGAAARTGVTPDGDAQAARMLASYLDAPATLVAQALVPDNRFPGGMELRREVAEILSR